MILSLPLSLVSQLIAALSTGLNRSPCDKLNLVVVELPTEELSNSAALAVVLCKHEAGEGSFHQTACHGPRQLKGKGSWFWENLFLLDCLTFAGAGLLLFSWESVVPVTVWPELEVA